MIEKETINYYLTQCIRIIKEEPVILHDKQTKAIINELITIMIDTPNQ